MHLAEKPGSSVKNRTTNPNAKPLLLLGGTSFLLSFSVLCEAASLGALADVEIAATTFVFANFTSN